MCCREVRGPETVIIDEHFCEPLASIEVCLFARRVDIGTEYGYIAFLLCCLETSVDIIVWPFDWHISFIDVGFSHGVWFRIPLPVAVHFKLVRM